MARDSASGSTIGAELRYGWTGREYDAETGFSFHRARYFDPESRRWTQEDPIGYAGGANVYAYVSGSPLESRDPSGMIPSADGITNRDYDKALMVPQPTWDGWFGISGTMLPELYTRVLINLTVVAILPGRPSENQWVKELYESGRPMNVVELLQVSPICSIDACSSVQIHETASMPEGAGVTLGYHIYVNFPSDPTARAQLLAHEVWHTRQFASLEGQISRTDRPWRCLCRWYLL